MIICLDLPRRCIALIISMIAWIPRKRDKLSVNVLTWKGFPILGCWPEIAWSIFDVDSLGAFSVNPNPLGCPRAADIARAGSESLADGSRMRRLIGGRVGDVPCPARSNIGRTSS